MARQGNKISAAIAEIASPSTASFLHELRGFAAKFPDDKQHEFLTIAHDTFLHCQAEPLAAFSTAVKTMAEKYEHEGWGMRAPLGSILSTTMRLSKMQKNIDAQIGRDKPIYMTQDEWASEKHERLLAAGVDGGWTVGGALRNLRETLALMSYEDRAKFLQAVDDDGRTHKSQYGRIFQGAFESVRASQPKIVLDAFAKELDVLDHAAREAFMKLVLDNMDYRKAQQLDDKTPQKGQPESEQSVSSDAKSKLDAPVEYTGYTMQMTVGAPSTQPFLEMLDDFTQQSIPQDLQLEFKVIAHEEYLYRQFSPVAAFTATVQSFEEKYERVDESSKKAALQKARDMEYALYDKIGENAVRGILKQTDEVVRYNANLNFPGKETSEQTLMRLGQQYLHTGGYQSTSDAADMASTFLKDTLALMSYDDRAKFLEGIDDAARHGVGMYQSVVYGFNQVRETQPDIITDTFDAQMRDGYIRVMLAYDNIITLSMIPPSHDFLARKQIVLRHYVSIIHPEEVRKLTLVLQEVIVEIRIKLRTFRYLLHEAIKGFLMHNSRHWLIRK